MGVVGGQLYVIGGNPSHTSVERMGTDVWEEVEQGLQGDFYNGGAIFIE